MKTETPTATKSAAATSAVVRGLNLLLADTYALMAITHQAHWNVEGSGFFSLHKAFHEQYENLFEAADVIAEQVRSLDAFPIGGLQTLAKESGIEEFKGPISAKDFVAGLIVAHEKAIADGKAVRDTAGQANDLETQDLVVDRLKWHQKTTWMLKSYLK